MMQTSVDVLIVGDGSLERHLTHYPLPDNVTTNFYTVDPKDISGKGMKSLGSIKLSRLPDIFILDSPEKTPVEGLKKSPFLKSAERVICARPDRVATLEDFISDEDVLFTDIWIRPLDLKTDKTINLMFGRLVKSVIKSQKLEISQIYLNTLIDSVPDLIWFKDLRGAHLKVNKAFGQAVGKTTQQCEGRGHYYIWDIEPDEYAIGEYVCLETEEEVIRRKETCLFDEKVKSKNGLRQFKTYKSPLIDPRGEMFGTVGIAKDVTDMQNLSRELEVILSSIPFATVIADDHGSVVYSNNKFTEYFGLSKKEAIGLRYEDICKKALKTSPEDLRGKSMMKISVPHGDGTRVLRAQQQSINDIFGNHFGYFLLCLDVTMEHELQDKILHSANTDFLTGLYNRRYFYEKIQEKIKEGPVSVIYFDLDNFKKVNDTYGHQAGDQALITTAAMLREAFQDEIVTRIGGDEFIVARFDSCDLEKRRAKVDRFIEQLTLKFKSQPKLTALSISAGIACTDDKDLDVDTLVSLADRALYVAKARGKACCALYGEFYRKNTDTL